MEWLDQFWQWYTVLPENNPEDAFLWRAYITCMVFNYIVTRFIPTENDEVLIRFAIWISGFVGTTIGLVYLINFLYEYIVGKLSGNMLQQIRNILRKII